ncbi:GHKL domain-containing protein [Mucilaginibacter frigoritolerans]|uniref:GHKL domain-containing protein n=1 Tax=Mucilaginibacter frigoritolerans TaxID=652788 RepID=A0A562TQ56_9SPHI|nr:sensor histidine kinase [Mucilaginibacter frigoritolerans]TWI95553.1 GHKL domain-containing protein [Mucilaginibacter frigoritolerans]
MRNFFLHLLFWVIFFLMWNQVVYFYISNQINRLYFSALDVSLIIAAFYMIYLYVVPNYFRRKSVMRLMLLAFMVVILLAGLYSWIMTIFLHHRLVPIRFDFSWNYTDLQFNRFFIALLGVLAGCFVKLGMDRIQVGRKMEIMEKEKSQAELTYLKAQINPHFLFNSLNSLYTQLELNPQAAKGTLVSLAELLRYQLYDCTADSIPLTKELAYLENYFNLQKIRKDNCSASLLIKGYHENLQIAPLLLILFVENAFKYVSDYDEKENSIHIEINVTNTGINFYCVNTFDVNYPQQADDMNKGIGLNNVKKRLELIYTHKFNLNVESKNELYRVELTLNLK